MQVFCSLHTCISVCVCRMRDHMHTVIQRWRSFYTVSKCALHLAHIPPIFEINVKTTVYTHVNGDRPSHIENRKKNKKSYITISLHIVVRQCAAV